MDKLMELMVVNPRRRFRIGFDGGFSVWDLEERYAIDPAKSGSELGWVPSTRFEDGIRQTVDWYLSHRSWWEEIISGEYRNYYEKMYASR